MAINPQTPGIHHIGLRSADMEVTKRFYRDVVGFKLIMDTPALLVFASGPVFIAFKQANAVHGKDVFSPYMIGLDHIALACESIEELNRVAAGLAAAQVENTGVKTDETLQKQYIAFKDPDRIQWEFYMV